MGYGDALQVSCLEGFDSLGLHHYGLSSQRRVIPANRTDELVKSQRNALMNS